MKNILRTFVALWYLLGWMVHIYLGLTAPQVYGMFGETALLPFFPDVWRGLILPNIIFFTLLLAAFEVVVGVLLVSKGRWVKYGLVLSIAFNLFLVQLGLSTVTNDLWLDFVSNRTPNLIFIALQLPLLRMGFEQTIPEAVATYFSKFTRKGAIGKS